jgi:hypothetical protein
MSLGVTAAGALLAAFASVVGDQASSGILTTFHATFACVGLITASSAWIFAQLAAETTGNAGQMHDLIED